MLYTRKGDDGTTKDLKSGARERKSKSSCQTEALGALDELNSFLGLVKVKSQAIDLKAFSNESGPEATDKMTVYDRRGSGTINCKTVSNRKASDSINQKVQSSTARPNRVSKPTNGSSFDLNEMDLAGVVQWIQNALFIVQAEVAGADKHVGQGKVTEMEGWIDSIEKLLPPIKSFFMSGGTELAALLDFSRTLARKAERRVIAGAEAGEFKIDPATLAFLNRLSSLLYALARLNNHKSGITEVPPGYQ